MKPNDPENIINKEIEPGVISEEMICHHIIEQGYKGEAGKLAAEESIRYDKIFQIRLENLSKSVGWLEPQK